MRGARPLGFMIRVLIRTACQTANGDPSNVVVTPGPPGSLPHPRQFIFRRRHPTRRAPLCRLRELRQGIWCRRHRRRDYLSCSRSSRYLPGGTPMRSRRRHTRIDADFLCGDDDNARLPLPIQRLAGGLWKGRSVRLSLAGEPDQFRLIESQIRPWPTPAGGVEPPLRPGSPFPIKPSTMLEGSGTPRLPYRRSDKFPAPAISIVDFAIAVKSPMSCRSAASNVVGQTSCSGNSSESIGFDFVSACSNPSNIVGMTCPSY